MKQLNILDSVDPKKNAHEKILEKLRTDMMALSEKQKVSFLKRPTFYYLNYFFRMIYPPIAFT